MSSDTDKAGLNANHLAYLQNTFRHIDKLLTDAEHTMIDAGSPSPFREHSDDSTPIQRKVAHDYIVRIREAMRRVMEELEMPPPEPRCGAVWAAGINLMFCSISLSELAPGKLRGYGALTPEGAALIDGIRAELDSLVRQLSNFLGKGGGADMKARLDRLSKTSDELRLLAELERIITAHGLVEFRGALTALLDRFETAAFEIGVFGRVSSGKSSLLNYILRTDVLPVGVTPVTAIPTRISYGQDAEAAIEFAEAQPRSVPFSELAEFATEEKNPSNKKHVTRIFLKLPAERLRDGIIFVDTPGLGSLAVAGAEETVAYLPRCDLGLVLVDASSGITQDDLVVVQSLYQAGATAMVLVSKADLFSEADRERMVDYAKTNLASQLGVEPPVHPISIMESHSSLCDRWLDEELRPVMAQHRELTVASQKRKVGSLREAVVAALERRSRLRSQPGDPLATAEQNQAGEALRSAAGALERAQGQAYVMTAKLVQLKPIIIDAAAEAIAAALLDSDAADPGKVFGETIARLLAEPVAVTLHSLEQTREMLLQAMQLADANSHPISEELPKPSGMPALDISEISHRVQIEKPVVISLFGKTALGAHVSRKLEDEYGQLLFEFLSLHANRLRRWMEQSIKSMHSVFVASADVQRAQLGNIQAESPSDSEPISKDLQTLRNWETKGEQLTIAS
jgi:GTP-binding protein EngB required for normal cell division